MKDETIDVPPGYGWVFREALRAAVVRARLVAELRGGPAFLSDDSEGSIRITIHEEPRDETR
jgi:hypothetical protein